MLSRTSFSSDSESALKHTYNYDLCFGANGSSHSRHSSLLLFELTFGFSSAESHQKHESLSVLSNSMPNRQRSGNKDSNLNTRYNLYSSLKLQTKHFVSHCSVCAEFVITIGTYAMSFPLLFILIIIIKIRFSFLWLMNCLSMFQMLSNAMKNIYKNTIIWTDLRTNSRKICSQSQRNERKNYVFSDYLSFPLNLWYLCSRLIYWVSSVVQIQEVFRIGCNSVRNSFAIPSERLSSPLILNSDDIKSETKLFSVFLWGKHWVIVFVCYILDNL